MPRAARAPPDAAGGRGPPPSRKCSLGWAPELKLAWPAASPQVLEISIEYDSEANDKRQAAGHEHHQLRLPRDGEAWGAAPVGKAQGTSGCLPVQAPTPTRTPACEGGAGAERPSGDRQSQGAAPPGSVPSPCPGSPLPTAARWPCLLPTGRSHSTLPPPSAEVGWGLGAPLTLLPPTFHCFAASANRLELGRAGCSVAISRPLLPAGPLPLGQVTPFLCLASDSFRTQPAHSPASPNPDTEKRLPLLSHAPSASSQI